LPSVRRLFPSGLDCLGLGPRERTWRQERVSEQRLLVRGRSW
jgi:hypothetical protein